MLTACANQSKRQEAEAGVLASWLQGRYDNSAQVQSGRQQGLQPHASIEIHFVRVRVPRIGDTVFYVQETSTDERRVLSQRLWSFDAAPKAEAVLHRIWSLTEPARWREGLVNPDLFVSVMPQDFTHIAGCDLLWKKEGEKYVGANDSAACRVSSSATGSVVRWSLRTELGPTDLGLADQSFDMAGKLVQGRTDEPFYRFQKR